MFVIAPLVWQQATDRWWSFFAVVFPALTEPSRNRVTPGGQAPEPRRYVGRTFSPPSVCMAAL